MISELKNYTVGPDFLQQQPVHGFISLMQLYGIYDDESSRWFLRVDVCDDLPVRQCATDFRG